MDESERRELQDDLIASVSDLLLPVPVLGALTKPLLRRVREEATRRRSIALMAAELTSGLSREALAEEILQDARLVPLLTRVLHAAGMNGHDRTLQAMGVALGDAIRQRDRLDECAEILASLDGLGPAHVLVLELLSQEPTADALALPMQSQPVASNIWQEARLRKEADLPSSLAVLVPAGLVARGLADRPMTRGAPGLEVTLLGHLVVEVLKQCNAAQ